MRPCPGPCCCAVAPVSVAETPMPRQDRQRRHLFSIEHLLAAACARKTLRGVEGAEGASS